MSAWSQSEGDKTHGTSPEDIAAHQKAYGSPTVGLPAGTYEQAAAPYESNQERAEQMKEWLVFGGSHVQSYKDAVIAFAKDRYGKDAQMKHMFDREAPKVLDQMAVEYDLPLWGIGLRSMDDLGTGEALHYWQYSGYTDEDGNKIPGAIELAHRGYYGGKDSGFLSGLASLLGNIFLPGGPVIQSLAERTIEGYRKANPNDPRYWPKHERSYTDALQAVRNEQRDKKRGIEEGFVASGKELIDMYKLGSDDKAKKEGTNAKPYTPADIINYNYDDFWKDLSEDNIWQANEPKPIKKKKLLPPPPLPAEPEEEELTGMAALLAKRPEATSREDSNVYLEALLNQIYGEPLGQSMLG